MQTLSPSGQGSDGGERHEAGDRQAGRREGEREEERMKGRGESDLLLYYLTTIGWKMWSTRRRRRRYRRVNREPSMFVH